jgi:HTH-type transcriptional regulator/antitoxin HigA
MKNIRAIRTEEDYDWALAEIEKYFDDEPAPGTSESSRFDVLADLIEAYEAKRWPIEPADPVEAIKYRMQISGYNQSDLAELLGSRSRASEILRRKRLLTVQMAHRLHKQWNIPADSLLRPYRLGREKDTRRKQRKRA